MVLWQLIAIQVATFALLIFFLWQLFYRQAAKTQTRLEHVYQDNLRREQELSRLMAEKTKELEAKTAQAEEDLRRLKAETQYELEQMREQAQAEAKTQAARIIAEAKTVSERTQARLVTEAEQQTITLAAEILRSLFTPRVAEGIHHHLVAGQIEEVARLESRRFALNGESAEVTVPTPLTPAQRHALTAALSAKVGRLITLQESADPALIAGIVVKIGTIVLDGSLQARLQATLTHVRETLTR